MLVHLFRAAALILSFAFAASAFAQTTVILQEGLNGYVGTTDTHGVADSPGSGFGNRADWRIGYDTNRFMPLMRFAIFAREGGPVPDGTSITSATLSLHKIDGEDGVVEIKRLLRSWDELQASWSAAATGTPWQVAGALGAADLAATAEGGGSFGIANGWYDVDVTASVQAFAAGAPNHGWRFNHVSGANSIKGFVARDDTASPTLRPKLTVTYNPPPSSSCISGPFGGTPAQVPGEIEAEDFDCGGEGVGYHDLTQGNQSTSTYRNPESVDVMDMTGGGRTVQFFDTGEWMAYTIDVPATDSYKLAISAAHNATPGTYRIEIDGVDVTGNVTVPNTTSWDIYQWVEAPAAVSLGAGQHVLKLVSVQQSYRVDKLRVTADPAGDCDAGLSRPFSGAPVNGIAIPVPSAGATFEAEHFNCGAEGAGYHDITAGNQSTSQFRSGTSADIMDIVTGGRTIQFFDTGEWMEYTIDVATAGSYKLGISAAHNATPGTYRIEVDGINATGDVTVTGTGSWDTYQWFDAANPVTLSAGQHVLRLVSVQQSFRVEKLRVIPEGGSGSGGAGCSPDSVFCHSFENFVTEHQPSVGGLGTCYEQGQLNATGAGGYALQAKRHDRAGLVTIPGILDGSKAVRLWTSGNDHGIHTSNHNNCTTGFERAELLLPEQHVGAVDVADNASAPTQWWAHSVYTPADFHMPPSGKGGHNVMQFHAVDPGGLGANQPNANIHFIFIGNSFPGHVAGCPQRPGGYNGHVLYLGAHAGSSTDAHTAELAAGCRQVLYLVPKLTSGETRKQLWYDFVHHVKWASHANVGFHRIWLRVRDESGAVLPVQDVNGNTVNGPALVMNKTDIFTKYPGKDVYFKTGTYHDDYGNIPGSVVHDRVTRGSTFASVSPFACPAGDTLCQ